MKRLPPAKRNHLIGVIFATIVLIGLVYFLLINPQNDKNRELANSINHQTAQLQLIKNSIKQMDESNTGLTEATKQMKLAEQDVASGDLYVWTYDTIRRFKANYHVDIPTPGQPTTSDCDLIGNFPYKQIRFSLTGQAFYHDLGKFVSDFENQFPHCRVVNLTADPAANSPAGGERLNFRMDIVALVKPTT